ncbi:DUF4407 domain-containing protein [Actinoplanes sp. N902-109]|uniref:DUF4407 domain-containing protein n=1 Tax=Actinoplanes sp. (strain N902-109) TaxID=649831 RepID=UPI0003295952|nr:DUF4407 domain-containing protein [Actinoplanes sp. N902-109]AGL20863.1 hypothetical protein L083_7353 [Actinoplanes sp. N902-109]
MRRLLLRIANVNPDSVTTHSDRVLYASIGAFIMLYFVYATAGGAAFVDASANYSHPWWMWLVGPLVASGVVAYDRAVVGRVAINYDRLESADPDDLLRRPTLGLYLGRVCLALLFAVIITEPLMLARYQGEIDARLNQVHNEQISEIEQGGAIAAYDARLAELKKQGAADDAAVQALNTRAAEKRADARKLYQQALADSEGDGVSRKAGCPAGGFCDTLVRRSRGLDTEAARLDRQAAALQQSQGPARTSRQAEQADLIAKISDQRTANAAAIRADSGFGARTKAMWYLVSTDIWGIGVFYIGIALLLVALDCAAVGLKIVSHGNAYERTEARIARRREHEQAIGYEQGLRDARRYAEAAARVMAESIGKASRDEELADLAMDRARTRLYKSVAAAPLPPVHLLERHPAARTVRDIDSLRA